MKLLVTCVPGAEDVTCEELEALLEGQVTARPLTEVRGNVVVECKGGSLELAKLIATRALTIHSVALSLGEGVVRSDREGLREIYDIAYDTPIHEYVSPRHTFAVRAQRIGVHEYTSLDVASVVGDAIRDKVEAVSGIKPKVNLRHPSVEVVARVVKDTFIMGILLTGPLSLHRRGYRVYEHPAALKPTIAQVMLRLVGASRGGVILDPMCGGGTIVIEAVMTYPLKAIAMDVSEKHLKGAMMNALAAGVADKVTFIRGDARDVGRYVSSEVDMIVTNPPYGIRLTRRKAIKPLYEGLIKSSTAVLKPGGMLAVITTEDELFLRLIEETRAPYELVHERRVGHGGLWPRILVFERL